MTPKNSIAIRELRHTLSQLNGGEGNTDAVVDFLVQELLLSDKHVKAWAVRRAVEQAMTEKGYNKMDAMASVAEQVGLSFYTVRKYVYTPYK